MPVGLGAALERPAATAFSAAARVAGGVVPHAEAASSFRVRRIVEIRRAPYDHHVDWRYQLRNLEAFHNLG